MQLISKYNTTSCIAKTNRIMIKKFNEARLHEDILSSISELGFVQPTPIQAASIPYILDDTRDLVALAHTGTGKTAAFGLPLIQLTDKGSNTTQTLILSPTRELCMQIAQDIKNYSKNFSDLKVLAVYGGAGIEGQIKILKKGVHIVVGTPGRTLDLIKRKALQVNNIKWLVLDEADEMLNMGFQEDLDAILENTSSEKRTFLFSATMPNGVLRIAKRYMTEWEKIAVDSENTSADSLEHIYYVAHSRNRFEALKRIIDEQPNIYAIVFCRTRNEAKELADSMIQSGYNADALHGDVPQAQRTVVMNRFKNRQLQLLIATDVAARGVDVNDLTHVINYNLPDDLEVYIHRSGRTGRAGKKGISVAIVHTREVHKIKDLEKLASLKFKKMAIPTGTDICKNQLFNLVDRIESVEVNDKQIEAIIPHIVDKLSWLSREELIKRIVSIEYNRFLEYYKNAEDLNITVNEKDKKSEKKFVALQVSIGSKHGMDARSLMNMVNDITNTNNIAIGKISVNKGQTIFEVERDMKKMILDAFKIVTEEYPDVVAKEFIGGVRERGSSSRGKKRTQTCGRNHMGGNTNNKKGNRSKRKR